MLRLYIMRHAKSSWGESGLADVDRSLNERGLNDLPHVAACMIKRNFLPDHIYCSSAKRTKMTVEGLFQNKFPKTSISFLDHLYSGGTQDYLLTLAGHSKPESLMIIAHNPCIHALANHLIEHGDIEKRRELAIKYPTGALTIIDFDLDDWGKLALGGGVLIDHIKPRDLRD